MYEEFFGLTERPFSAAVRVDRYYPAASIEQSRQTLTRAIQRGDGFGIVVGPSGTGKSLLSSVLAEQLRAEFKIAHLSTGRLCSPRALLQAILYELRLPYRNMSEGELRLSLVDHLEPSADCSKGMLLIVDEAHSLPVRLFEEIRMITNLVRNGQPRVQLVLAGNARLEERLNEPRLDSFSQRVIARCYLEPFTRDDTTQFVCAQFAAAGGKPDQVFDEAALIAIHRATEGIGRLVNQLADHAMILARTAGSRRIDAARIEEAWADLQQLPPPWNATSETIDQSEATIEFGSLEDELDAEMPNAALADESDVESLPFVTRFDKAEPSYDEDRQATPPCGMENEIERAARHLDQIDARIAQLNSESVDGVLAQDTPEQQQIKSQVFRPLGSFQQEVEYDLAAVHNPLAESFDEEEVIIDRYAAMSGSLAGRPQVYSTEGRAIADALAPHDIRPPSPRLAEVDEADHELIDSEPTREFAESDWEETGAAPEVDSAPETDLETEQAEVVYDAVSDQQSSEPLVVIDEDQDDEIEAEQPPATEVTLKPKPQISVVKPNQFGSLFTNLRRNTGS